MVVFSVALEHDTELGGKGPEESRRFVSSTAVGGLNLLPESTKGVVVVEAVVRGVVGGFPGQDGRS